MKWYHPATWRLSWLLLAVSERLMQWSVRLSPYRTMDGVAKYHRFLRLDDETVWMLQRMADEDGVGPEDVIGQLTYGAYHERHPEQFCVEAREEPPA